VRARAIFFFAIASLLVVARSTDSDAHKRADMVLYPRFVSVSNDWATQHYRGSYACPGASTEVCDAHFQTLNVGDMKRWTAVREAFKELDDEFKKAGYR
jgi:hypothetical protein